MVVWSDHLVVGTRGLGGFSPHPTAVRKQGKGYRKGPGEGRALKTCPSDPLATARSHLLTIPSLPKQILQIQSKHPTQEPVGGSSSSSHNMWEAGKLEG